VWFAKLIPRVLIELAQVLRRGKPPHQSSVALCTSTSIVRYPASEPYVGTSSRFCAETDYGEVVGEGDGSGDTL
jgi:hypothetical protein